MAILVIRQFAVLANPGAALRQKAPYLVILQSHHLDTLTTTLVAPLIRSDVIQPDPLVMIAVDFEGAQYTLDLALIANIDRRRLGRPLGSLAGHEDAIRRALDRLFSGF